MSTIYQRLKNDAGKWRYEAVRIAPGIRTGDLKPPFYVRRKQQWYDLKAENFADAKKADAVFDTVRAAAAMGLTVKEYEDKVNANRVPLKKAVEAYLVEVAKKPRTLAAYRLTLDEFTDVTHVRFVDEITTDVLKKYVGTLRSRNYATKTVWNRVINLHSFLNTLVDKKTDAPLVTARLNLTKYVGKPEKTVAKPYSDEDVKKLLDSMPADLRVTFRFFLGSGCREQEVQFAAWSDIDLTAKTYTITEKPDVGFTLKSHVGRVVPLPTGVVNDLKELKKTAEGRWLFPSKQGKPDGHLLRKLKRAAFHAGLNCGHCVNRAGQSCKDHDVCANFKLHRFRKTCATRWSNSNIPLRDIQEYLGHESLNTTQEYLGLSDIKKVRGKVDNAFGD